MEHFQAIRDFNLTPQVKRGIIQYLYSKKVKITQISKEIGVSRPTIYRWIKRDSVLARKRNRKYKLKPEYFDFIAKEAANKFGIKTESSARGIKNKLFV